MGTQLATNNPLDKLRIALLASFPARKVDEILLHYEILSREAQLDRYESCLVNGGKFVEAVLKCLHYRRTRDEVDSVRVDEEIRLLESAFSLSESERMTIPRTLRIIYEHRNKRGGAHNSSFDPTKMDCAFVVAASSWVMEELTRLYLINDPFTAQALVENLLVKHIPLVEEIDGDPMILKLGLSARVQLEILLYYCYPNRCTMKDLIRWVRYQSDNNVRTTLRNMMIKGLVHENETGWKLTQSGVHDAEAEIAKILDSKGVKRGRK